MDSRGFGAAFPFPAHSHVLPAKERLYLRHPKPARRFRLRQQQRPTKEKLLEKMETAVAPAAECDSLPVCLPGSPWPCFLFQPGGLLEIFDQPFIRRRCNAYGSTWIEASKPSSTTRT